jgi:cardiolipin synthase
MNIPNTITVLRIIMVPVIIWLILSGGMFFAFVIFVMAGISDAADGYLAKRYNWQTELGAYLDAIADKILLVSVFLALGHLGYLPLWLVILCVSRDGMIIAALLLSWLMDRPIQIKPLMVSKANTTSQILVICVVMADLGLGLSINGLTNILIAVTAALTAMSMLAYLLVWMRHMMRYEG